MVDNCNGYAQRFVADVDGAADEEIPGIRGRVEDDALILLISVISSNRADRSANNEYKQTAATIAWIYFMVSSLKYRRVDFG